MSRFEDGLPDPEHISVSSLQDPESGEYQSDIRVDGVTIVAVDYVVGDPVEVTVINPEDNEIAGTHQFEAPKENASLRTYSERTASILTENAKISLPRNLIVDVTWDPGRGIKIAVKNPNKEGWAGKYEFPDPVSPKDRKMNINCPNCGPRVQRNEKDECGACGSTNISKFHPDPETDTN